MRRLVPRKESRSAEPGWRCSGVKVQRCSNCRACFGAGRARHRGLGFAWEPSGSRPQEVTQVVLTNEQQYAKDLNIPEDQARFRLALQEEVGTWLADLGVDDRPTVAGVWFEHIPEFRLVVWLAQADPQLERELSRLPIQVEFKRETALSLQELRVAQAAAASGLDPRFRAGGIGLDIRTNSVVIEVEPTAANDSDLHQEATRLATGVGTAVVIRELDAPGSDDVMRGGRSVGSCTSGFAIGNYSGSYGFLTSAHCLDLYDLYSCALTYDGAAGSCWRNHNYGASADVQHRTVPGDSAAAEFWNGGSYIPVHGAYSWSAEQVGWYTCHYGVNTGNSCGVIVDKYYKPDYGGACPGGPCNSDWVKVSNPGWTSLACDHGDSGGPWFGSTSAYGIHKTSPGSDCVYMPIDRITAMWVFVLTQ